MHEGDIVRHLKRGECWSGILHGIENIGKKFYAHVFDPYDGKCYTVLRDNLEYDESLFRIGESTEVNLAEVKKEMKVINERKGKPMSEAIEVGHVVKNLGKHKDVTGVVCEITEDLEVEGMNMGELKLYLGADVPRNERVLNFTTSKFTYDESFIKVGEVEPEEMEAILKDLGKDEATETVLSDEDHEVIDEVIDEIASEIDPEIMDEVIDEVEAEAVADEAEAEASESGVENLDVSVIFPGTDYSNDTLDIFVRTRDDWFRMTRTTAKRAYYYDNTENRERFCSITTVTHVRRIG